MASTTKKCCKILELVIQKHAAHAVTGTLSLFLANVSVLVRDAGVGGCDVRNTTLTPSLNWKMMTGKVSTQRLPSPFLLLEKGYAHIMTIWQQNGLDGEMRSRRMRSAVLDLWLAGGTSTHFVPKIGTLAIHPTTYGHSQVTCMPPYRHFMTGLQSVGQPVRTPVIFIP